MSIRRSSRLSPARSAGTARNNRNDSHAPGLRLNHDTEEGSGVRRGLRAELKSAGRQGLLIWERISPAHISLEEGRKIRSGEGIEGLYQILFFITTAWLVIARSRRTDRTCSYMNRIRSSRDLRP